jgi:hypothetical protein
MSSAAKLKSPDAGVVANFLEIATNVDDSFTASHVFLQILTVELVFYLVCGCCPHSSIVSTLFGFSKYIFLSLS